MSRESFDNAQTEKERQELIAKAHNEAVSEDKDFVYSAKQKKEIRDAVLNSELKTMEDHNFNGIKLGGIDREKRADVIAKNLKKDDYVVTARYNDVHLSRFASPSYKDGPIVNWNMLSAKFADDDEESLVDTASVVFFTPSFDEAERFVRACDVEKPLEKFMNALTERGLHAYTVYTGRTSAAGAPPHLVNESPVAREISMADVQEYIKRLLILNFDTVGNPGPRIANNEELISLQAVLTQLDESESIQIGNTDYHALVLSKNKQSEFNRNTGPVQIAKKLK